MATYSSDLTIAAVLLGKPEPPTFEWAVLPYPPGSETRVNFNDIGLYAMSSKTPNKDLAWEVLKWWTNGEESAYWTGVSGTYPARVDAAEMGYDETAPPQLAASFDLFQKYSVGPEPFAAMGHDRGAGRSAGRPRLQRRDHGRRSRQPTSSRSCSKRSSANQRKLAD